MGSYDFFNKRIDDLKWYIGIFSGSVALLIAGLSILVGLNLSSERQSINQLRVQLIKEINEELGNVSSPPTLSLENTQGIKLADNILQITQSKNLQIQIPWRINNTGKSWSGAMFAKIYTNPPLCFRDKTINESDYETETYLSYNDFSPDKLPPGVSLTTIMGLDSNCELKLGDKAKIKIILFYGRNQQSEAEFKVELKK